MRVRFLKRGTVPQGSQVVTQKLKRKHASPRKHGEHRGKLGISKGGRLVTIEFACRLEHSGLHDGQIVLSEDEILMLASLCRRDRTDEQLLRAISDAGLGSNEIRKTRRTAKFAE